MEEEKKVEPGNEEIESKTNHDLEVPDESYISQDRNMLHDKQNGGDNDYNHSEIAFSPGELRREVSTTELIKGDLLDTAPPDWNRARIHANAQKCKDFDKIDADREKLNDARYFCPCCQLPTTEAAPLYNYCWGIMEMEDLGCGFPLYFYFKIYMGIIYFLMSLVITLVGWILYSRQDHAEEWVGSEDAPFITYISIGSFGKDEDRYKSTEVNVMVLLNTLMILTIYILNMLFRPFQIRVIKKVDEMNITPGDFTVMMTNIPRDKNKEQISEWILDHAKDANIWEINICYDIKEAVSKIQRINKLKVILANFERYKLKYKEDVVEAEIRKLNGEVEYIKEKMQDDENDKTFTGKVFIIFDKQSEAENLVWGFKRTWIRRLFNFIYHKV